MFEAFRDSCCSFGMQYGGNVIAENIAESDHTVTVETAGDDGSVCEDAEMVAQTVAGEAVAFDPGVAVGPLKPLTPFEVDLVADPDPSCVFCPFSRDIFPENVKNRVVFAAVKALVPKAENRNDPFFGSTFCKFSELEDIAGMCGRIIVFEAVNGEIDLVYTGVQKLVFSGVKPRSVRCDDGLKTGFTREPDEFGKLGVRERFSHQVIIDVFCLPGELIKNEGEFIKCHSSRFSSVPVAERTAHITYICDLYIYLIIHGDTP